MRPPPSYAALYAAYVRTCRRAYALQRRYQALVDARLVATIRRSHPRRKLPPYPRSDPRYKEIYQELYAAVLPRYTARQQRTTARERHLARLLDYRALRSPVVPTTEERLLYVYDSCDHLSQGYGASKYALAAAQARGDMFEAAGLPVRIVTEDQRASANGGRHAIHRVYGHLDAAGKDQLERRPVDLVEAVRRSWQRGANPRVARPFLPHGFEETHGLDFFGGRVAVPLQPTTL